MTEQGTLHFSRAERLLVRPLSLNERDATTRTSDQTFEAAFTRLFHEQFQRLFRYLDRRSGDPQLADDLTQEAFVRLHARGTMPEDPAAWLITVALNILRDDQRRVVRRLRLLDTVPDGVATATPPIDPAVALEHDERQRQVRTALERIPERDRDALLLRHAGYSYREVATALDLNPASVGTILVRATAAFRAAWEELHGLAD